MKLLAIFLSICVLIYYEPEDKTPESEKKLIGKLLNWLGDFSFKLDVKNQARVHLWYENKFGSSIEPYHSLEAAIDSWPTTATALGLRHEQDGSYTIYATYDLDDLISVIVRPNKLMIAREIFEDKAKKWRGKWPKLFGEYRLRKEKDT